MATADQRHAGCGHLALGNGKAATDGKELADIQRHVRGHLLEVAQRTGDANAQVGGRAGRHDQRCRRVVDHRAVARSLVHQHIDVTDIQREQRRADVHRTDGAAGAVHRDPAAVAGAGFGKLDQAKGHIGRLDAGGAGDAIGEIGGAGVVSITGKYADIGGADCQFVGGGVGGTAIRIRQVDALVAGRGHGEAALGMDESIQVQAQVGGNFFIAVHGATHIE